MVEKKVPALRPCWGVNMQQPEHPLIYFPLRYGCPPATFGDNNILCLS